MRGLFISFEGSEGCGKSTQISLLRERLSAAGVPVLMVREPGGTAVGESVREVLLRHPEPGQELCAEAELLLFAASRAQLVREKVQPALQRGEAVIADRFLDSTTVYQGHGRGLDPDAVQRINSLAVGDCRPHLTFLLDMDAAAAHARALQRSGGRPDRMEAEPPAFYERIRQGYLDLAEREPRRIVRLDAGLPPAQLAAAIWERVEARLGRPAGPPA